MPHLTRTRTAPTTAPAPDMSAVQKRTLTVLLVSQVLSGVGLAAGYLGGAGVVAAAALTSPALLLISLFLYGAGTTSNLQARYAGADLAAPRQRARATSTVIVATTAGGIAGPLLATPAGHLATALHLPALTGLFLLSTAAATSYPILAVLCGALAFAAAPAAIVAARKSSARA
ncbi:hypothetical protein ACF05T_13490 [Streptomyces lateritius]|uniref:Uncharacterized protein n=1 Tax=Streptomyces lateritius TaxID=67313 RepID=A0ABW6YB96_9ACTN